MKRLIGLATNIPQQNVNSQEVNILSSCPWSFCFCRCRWVTFATRSVLWRKNRSL